MSSTLWYAARAGGLVSYLLLSCSVVLGLLLSARARLEWPRFAVEDVHRYLAILTGVFLGVHVGAIALDQFVPFGLTNLLVPFTASYRPFATGLGVVAAELLVGVAVTNAVRDRIPHRVWRQAHYATLAVWILACVHGVLAGTDRHEPWMLTLYVSAAAAVAVAGLSRFRPETAWPSLVAAVPAATMVVAALASLSQAPSH
jgi:methionine sulfoxide reductase heme-binding subunit